MGAERGAWVDTLDKALRSARNRQGRRIDEEGEAERHDLVVSSLEAIVPEVRTVVTALGAKQGLNVLAALIEEQIPSRLGKAPGYRVQIKKRN